LRSVYLFLISFSLPPVKLFLLYLSLSIYLTILSFSPLSLSLSLSLALSLSFFHPFLPWRKEKGRARERCSSFSTNFRGLREFSLSLIHNYYRTLSLFHLFRLLSRLYFCLFPCIPFYISLSLVISLLFLSHSRFLSHFMSFSRMYTKSSINIQ